MPSLKSLRRRIVSVKSTQKITKAMKLVAAARLKRAQQRITDLRPYAEKTTELLGSLAPSATLANPDEIHPLLAPRTEVKNVLIVTLSSDRGLAGAYNSNVNRATDRRLAEITNPNKEIATTAVLATLGRKGRDYFRRKKVEIAHDFTGFYDDPARRAGEIARQIIEEYQKNVFDKVEIVFTEFKSAMVQKVRVEPLLPIQSVSKDKESKEEEEKSVGGRSYVYEPNATTLLDRLLPMYVEVSILRAILDSLASEHGARMTAMDNATKNAKEMIGSLTLQYNRLRQAAITKELMEIIGGAEALKG